MWHRLKLQSWANAVCLMAGTSATTMSPQGGVVRVWQRDGLWTGSWVEKRGWLYLHHSGLIGMYCREKTPSLVIQKGTERWCPEVSDWDTDPSDPSGMGCSGISNRAETGDFCTIHHAKLAEEGVK